MARTPCQERQDKAQRMASVVISTIVIAFPFYGIIRQLAHVQHKILKPCTGGCTFIRFWGSEDMPSSSARYLPTVDSMSNRPAFMHITTGEKEITIDSDLTWYEAFPRSYTNLAQFVAKWCRSVIAPPIGLHIPKERPEFLSPVCPGKTKEEMVEMCRLRDETSHVGNHLNQAPTLKVYLTCIPAWAILRVLHDWLLICGASEKFSLMFGFLSILPQIIAFSSGFLWAIGAAEVFASPHHNCACYYQMAPLPMFTLLATPVALYWATRDKLWKLGYAVLHGDYLFSVNYDVPYSMAVQSGGDPTYGFVTRRNAVADDDQEPSDQLMPASPGSPSPERELTMACYQLFSKIFMVVGNCFEICAAYFVYAFAFPTLTVRLYGLVVADDHKNGPHGGHLPHWCLFVLRMVLLFATISGTGYSVIKQVMWFIDGFRTARADFMREEERQRNFRCVRMYVGECFDLIVRGGSLYASIFSPLLAYYILQAEPLNATNAGHIGASGFLLFAALLKSYNPSGTQRRTIYEAIQIKGGILTMKGLSGVKEMNKEYPHLGLHREAECVTRHQEENKSPLDQCGFGHEGKEYDKWTTRLSQELHRRPSDKNGAEKIEASNLIEESSA